MKVNDLIEDLKYLPPDTEVYVYNPRWKVTPYISVVSTYDESNRRVLYLLSEVEEDIEEKMEAEKSANRKEEIEMRCKVCGAPAVIVTPIGYAYCESCISALYGLHKSRRCAHCGKALNQEVVSKGDDVFCSIDCAVAHKLKEGIDNEN